ncbi:tubulin-specific chaperone E isoform X2 [Chelmon rostratus]|uniref:tubulin-specific chaperone E isoform X2 n=1 Tax=Chelmon rostratus TaxID=109905 RepID=UPI001BE5316C|nr:tubulin-specific chaperone E isoform X2 [Chelmon rostratus]
MGPDQTEPEVPADAVGRRVSCGAERGTVQYVGPVPPTAGLWLGIEWDHPERGKHNGSHDGVQYFTCRHPKGGSFVRPRKVSFGVDFLTAVRQLYQINTEEVLSYGSSKKLTWKGIQERSFENLPSLLLLQSEVNGPGADGEIRKTTPNVQWLDLTGTLLSSWDDVAAITQQLDQLEGLMLNNNRLCLPSDPSAHCQAFYSLRVLALIDCDLTWPQILDCATMWPQLQDLCVEDNNITELQRPDGVLQSLEILNLSCNPIVQDSVLSIGTLPRLEQLNLSKTGLSALRFDDTAPGSQTSMFPALKSLNLDHNNISEWWVVDELAKLPSLVTLWCRRNQLVSSDGNPRTASQMIIAKLGQLAVLNSCEILREDRRGAELDYIKMFGEEWLKAGGGSEPSSQFTCQHPRYLSLINKYGAPGEGELKKLGPFVLKNQLLKIVFVFPDDPGRKPIEKKLPAFMVVQKVKGLLYRLLKVPAADLKLTYTTLKFYSIEDGDQVLVRWS